MTSFDRCRRAVTVLLVATFLVLVPQLATAKFTATQVATQSVGTATMGTPTSVIGTWQCWVSDNGGKGNGNGNGYNHGSDHDNGWEAVTVSVASFTDSEPSGATYNYSLERAGLPWKWSFSSANRNGWLVNGSLDDNAPTTWTLTIQSSYGHWTGVAYQGFITCPKDNGAQGSLPL